MGKEKKMELTKSELTSLLIKYVNEYLDPENNQIKNDSMLSEYEGFNSMFVVEFIMYIEEVTNLTVPDDMYVMDRFYSIDRIVESVEQIQTAHIA